MLTLRRSLAVLALALLATSCSSADTLASVNDTRITRDELVALRPSYAEPALVSAEQMRADLTQLIVIQAAVDAAAELGVEFTAAEIQERLFNPPERYASIILTPDSLGDATMEAVKQTAILTLIHDGVVPLLAEEEAGSFEALIADRPEDVTRACVRHISTDTVEEAEEVLARLGNGEDFAAVADEVSGDSGGTGGLVGTEDDCLLWLTSLFSREFANVAATAPLNEPSGPISVNGMWEVIMVEERIAPSSAVALAADPIEYLDPTYTSALFSPWFSDAIASATVDVSPTVGRWLESSAGIAPPGA
jgi:parvulin-like peptidyl-prolyl isomerase